MIGILIVSHGDLGRSLADCASHVLESDIPQLAWLGVAPGDDPDVIVCSAEALIGRLDGGDGVLVLSDICGATPCNVATRLVVPGRVACVAGANLPMLLRALTYRGEPLAAVADKALAGGREGVMRIAGKSHDAV
ncbi:PTS system, ascorbate-specific IIA component [Nitrosovibrio sp. Nv17]|nr:PTS fructose transporter subunit IIA [Nitrosovibrio sp. Nv17]SFW33085.1 PTS system, ascorbate-specific IIA component [Nitrosovibrio sp. Nv17]